VSTAHIPEVLPAPPGRPPTLPQEDIALVLPVRRTSVAQHLLRFVLAVGGWAWRWLVGAVMCFNFFVLSWFTSIAVVGWTNRVVQQLVLRCWWWRSELRRRMTFAEFCDSLGVDAPSPRPRWFVQDHLRVHARQPLRGGGRPDFVTVAGRTLWWPWYSLWLNFKLGVKATFCTLALLALPCMLMLWSWEQGWINSFHGGYEQSWLGPTMGFAGIFLYCAVMIYVPMAQTHQAVTGQARAFFDFRFVWQLIGARITAYLLLALTIGFWAFVLTVARNMVASENFAGNRASSPEAGLAAFRLYLFALSLAMFPVYVLLRCFAGVIYQSAVLKLLRRGKVTYQELHPVLRRWHEALHLRIIPRAETVSLGFWARLTARTTYQVALLGTLYWVWFFFLVRFYVGYFFVYEPYLPILNHPLIQVPCFDFVPVHLYMGRDL